MQNIYDVMEKLEVIEEGDFLIIKTLIDELSLMTRITDIAKQSKNIIKNSEYKKFIFDLTKIIHIDSSAIGWLIEMHNIIVKQNNNTMGVVINKNIYSVLAQLNLDKIVPYYYDMEMAKKIINNE